MATKRARVKVKKSTLTRAEAAAEFERKKARQRRREWHQRIMKICLGLIAIYLLVGAWILVRNGVVEKAVDTANIGVWNWTGSLGFKLDQVTLTGRKFADADAVKAALAIDRGMPILALPLTEMKARLEAIPEIKSATLIRTLPSSLKVELEERQPAAVWQHQGKVVLIDRDGVALNRAKYPAIEELPIVVGSDAPHYIQELLTLLHAVPSLRPDIRAAVRVGGRRWNIELERDITVLLPEEQPIAAWKRFAKLVETRHILGKAIRSVDMRLEDRVFIMPIEPTKNPVILTNTRDI